MKMMFRRVDRDREETTVSRAPTVCLSQNLKYSTEFSALMGLSLDSKNEGDISTTGKGATRPVIPTYETTSSFGSCDQQANSDEDDDVHPTSPSPMQTSASKKAAVIIPDISVKSEFKTIGRKSQHSPKQALSCLVTIQVPQAVTRDKYDVTPLNSGDMGDHAPGDIEPQTNGEQSITRKAKAGDRVSVMPVLTGIPSSATRGDGKDPFSHILSDLKARMVDYRGSGIDKLGRIRLFDILKVRKGGIVLDISVYLFQHALVCVTEEKKKSLRGFLNSSPSYTSLRYPTSEEKASRRDKGILKLKGRIYFKHVRRVIDTSISGELSLTISMEDENVDSFILAFRDKNSLELWRKTILEAVQEAKSNIAQLISPISPATSASASLSNKLAKMGFDNVAVEAAQYSPKSISHGRFETTTISTHASSANISGQSESGHSTSSLPVPLLPRHTPLDLMIVCSVPPISSTSSSSALKLRLIKAALEHVCISLGPSDRVSIVTYEHGSGGRVRKTPFIAVGRVAGHNKMNKFLASLGSNITAADIQAESDNDEFAVPVDKEGSTDMITGVNVGLDKFLQRRTKNPIGGLILIHDNNETVKRAAMDLVLARAEGAK
jgi:hypothetical protein